MKKRMIIYLSLLIGGFLSLAILGQTIQQHNVSGELTATVVSSLTQVTGTHQALANTATNQAQASTATNQVLMSTAVSGAKQRAAQSGLELITADNVNRMRLLETFKKTEQEDRVTSVAISPDGTILASAALSTVTLRDLANGHVRASLALSTDSAPRSMAFSPDGAILAVGDSSGVILYDVGSGKERTLHYDLTPAGQLEAVGFSPDGTSLFVVSEMGNVRFYNVASGQHWKEKDKDLDAQAIGQNYFYTGVALSPDGTMLASSSDDHALRLWDLTSGKLTATFPLKGGFAMAFNFDGSVLAVNQGIDGIKLINVASGDVRGTLAVTSGEALAFSPDGLHFATASLDGLLVWSVLLGRYATPIVEVVTDSNDEYEFVGAVPAEWKADDSKPAEYQIRIRKSYVEIQRCSGYKNAYDPSSGEFVVIRRQINFKIEIIDLKQKSTLADKTFEGAQPDSCALTETEVYKDGPTPVVTWQFQSWLRQVLEGK